MTSTLTVTSFTVLLTDRARIDIALKESNTELTQISTAILRSHNSVEAEYHQQKMRCGTWLRDALKAASVQLSDKNLN